MKIRLVLFVLLLNANLFAQNADSLKIKASDPTQIYTSVELYGGLNFIDFNYANSELPYLDTWELGFRGNWAIKKFRIGVFLPTSNNSKPNQIFDDISINAGYQIHNNTGLYNATVVNAGFSSASQDREFYSLPQVYPNSSNFSKIHVSYLGALKFSDKLSFYPGVEWYTKMDASNAVHIYVDSVNYWPQINTRGWKFSGTFSYDINPKNFLQLYTGWSFDNWVAKYGSVPIVDEYLSGFNEQRLIINLKYQYAFTPYAQAYLSVNYNDWRFDDGQPNNYSDGRVQQRLYSFQLGFTYFLH